MTAVAVQLALSAMGLAACWLLAEKRRSGWAVGLALNLAFTAYAAATAQWGLIVAELAYVVLNARGWHRWHTTPEETPVTIVRNATTDRVGTVRRDVPDADVRHAIAVILAHGLDEALDDLHTDGYTRCPQIARDDARQIAQMFGLLPTPEPANPTRTNSDYAAGRTR